MEADQSSVEDGCAESADEVAPYQSVEVFCCSPGRPPCWPTYNSPPMLASVGDADGSARATTTGSELDAGTEEVQEASADVMLSVSLTGAEASADGIIPATELDAENGEKELDGDAEASASATTAGRELIAGAEEETSVEVESAKVVELNGRQAESQ